MGSTAVKRALTRLTLKPVKRILFTFDPFHENVRSIRETLYLLKSKDIILTNPECRTKIEIVADRSAPIMDVDFNDGEKLIMKTELLTTVEIVDHLGILCKEKAPPKTEAVKPVDAKKAKKKKK